MRKRNPLRRAAAWLAAVCLTLPLLTSPAGSTGAQSTASSAAAGEVVGYYAGWSSYLGYAPGDVPAEQLTQINYAFAAIDGDTGKLVLDNPTQDKKNFQGLLALIHSCGSCYPWAAGTTPPISLMWLPPPRGGRPLPRAAWISSPPTAWTASTWTGSIPFPAASRG